MGDSFQWLPMGNSFQWLYSVSLSTHILCLLVAFVTWNLGCRVWKKGAMEPLLWPTLSSLITPTGINYHLMFTLGFACSLFVGFFRNDQGATMSYSFNAKAASEKLARALDQVLSSDTMERLLSTTSTLRDVLDTTAWNVSSAASLYRNKTFGIAELFSTWSVPDVSRVLGTSERVGIRMARNGSSVHHPVVMIPGIITTGLEVWDGEECIKSYFRQRIWGTTSMFRSMLGDPECWLRHLSLNSTTGLDPLQMPHLNRSIRVRPAQGFESADFFLGGYWLWGWMIEALADIGYDLNSMFMASYDWRLSFADMERRDRYFTRLRQQIETLVAMNGQKCVIVAHSMGGNIWHYFMQWVTKNVHANWVHDHIASEALISSPLLGTPKAYYSLLVGDNRDFASMGRLGSVVNHFLGPIKRRKLWRSFTSLAHISPIGEDLWDLVHRQPLVQLNGKNLTQKEAYDLLAKSGDVPEDLERISSWLLDGIRRTKPPDRPEEAGEHLWPNALAVPLPFAPQLKMYALYGGGLPTELTAFLEETGDDVEQPKFSLAGDAATTAFEYGDGDYSCTTASLGLMCAKGWSSDKRNPARIPCTIKEYRDKPSPLLERGVRGGPSSGDHIDLLGNEELLTDVLTIVSGGTVDERIESNLHEVLKKWDDK